MVRDQIILSQNFAREKVTLADQKISISAKIIIKWVENQSTARSEVFKAASFLHPSLKQEIKNVLNPM